MEYLPAPIIGYAMVKVQRIAQESYPYVLYGDKPDMCNSDCVSQKNSRIKLVVVF